jgi:arylsulfatase A-like enzyme
MPGSRCRRLRRRRAARLCGALSSLAFLLVSCQDEVVAPTLPRPGRIILFSMDTVRADHANGEAAPVLGEIAGSGVRFERFYAASNYTLPSHMSIFTGLDPMEHGVIVGAARLAPEVPTLAERLARAGYLTWSFNESGYIAARYGFDRGFAEYRSLPPKHLVGAGLPEVLSWMREHQDTPYFLFLHTYAAHFPYGGYGDYRAEHPDRNLLSEAELDALRTEAPRRSSQLGRAAGGFPSEMRARCTLYNQLASSYLELLGCGYNWLPQDFLESAHYEADRDLAVIRASYDAQIGRIDAALQAIRETLRELSQWDDTLLVVTADHGEGFFEHGLYQHDYSPFDEVLRVPLVISFPDLLSDVPEREPGTLAWHLDLTPTLLRLAGADPVDATGMDLTPALLGGELADGARGVFPVVLSAPNRPRKPTRRVALHDLLKRIEGYPTFGDSEGLLFDLARDPGEQNNLRSERPEALRLLTAMTAEYAGRLELRSPVHSDTGEPIDLGRMVPSPKLSEEERELLRGLGYLH